MTVGYKLRREIEDWFPGACTPAERLVALQIADDAKETTRISLIPLPLLCARTGLTIDGLRKALQRLSKRGLEFRISHGTGRDGRQVFTKRGAEIEFRVPSMNEFMTVYNLTEGSTGVLPELNGSRSGAPP